MACGQLVRSARLNPKVKGMAIYHLSVKAVSRSAGRSATAAAAYRAGCEIADERTGEIHDYTRKGGVESADIVLPDGSAEWATDRAKLWNAAELAERRKDSCVAREFEVALPSELSPEQRKALALDFAQRMADREGCAVDVCIHAPGKDGDNRNHHAHILRTTRKVEAEGLGAKLDTEKAGRNRSADLEAVRREWAELTNAHLERAGHAERVDHRSNADRGIDAIPSQHLGPAASAIERRGEVSQKRMNWEAEALDRLSKARDLGHAERDVKEADRYILDLETSLDGAIRERDQQREQAEKEFRRQLEAEREAAKAVTSHDLAAEIERLRPPPVAHLVEQDPQMIEARRRIKELEDAARANYATGRQAQTEAEQWRKDHPLKAKAHDSGLMRSEYLEQREQTLNEARTTERRLRAELGKREEDRQALAKHIGGQIEAQQSPTLARIEQLNRQRVELQLKEREATQEQKRLDEAPQKFETMVKLRQHKAFGYTDSSEKWKQMPEKLRQLVDTCVSNSEKLREVMAAMRQSPDVRTAVGALMREAEARAQQRGMER